MIGEMKSMWARSDIKWAFWVAILCVSGCTSRTANPTPPAATADVVVSAPDLDVTTGQTIFVPAYSGVYYGSGDRTVKLAVTLHIHNTDLDHPIVITSVRYYDAQGQQIKEFLTQPRSLGPIASLEFFVDSDEQGAGLGSNFIMEWVAEQAVYEPVVEAVMISTGGTQGISFTSPGRVIRQLE